MLTRSIANDMDAPSKGGSPERFYAAQAAHTEHNRTDEMRPDPDSVDAWRHDRMFAPLGPLSAYDLNASWLTIGDGRYGSDARRLIARGAVATASDLFAERLEAAHAAGLLPAFRKENAEALSCADESFDFVLCKEAYHHFPRPAIALYEMFRVCRRGVVLIEPNDQFAPERLGEFVFTRLRERCQRLLGRPSARATNTSLPEISSFASRAVKSRRSARG